MKVCAITNVYNERFNLKIWLSYYGRQVGIEHCIVLDHGSDDGSTDNLYGACRIPLPRGATFSDHDRLLLVNNFANGLLGYYDAVIYADADEMVIADPHRYCGLKHYISEMKSTAAYSVGLNLRSSLVKEAPIDEHELILRQRSLVQFVTPMCKPSIITAPVKWSIGFHFCDVEPQFGDLYLFHLRHVCASKALDRLSVTRNIAFAEPGAGAHQRRADVEYLRDIFCSVDQMPVRDDWDFSEWTKAHMEHVKIDSRNMYAPRIDIRSTCLYAIPERFRNSF